MKDTTKGADVHLEVKKVMAEYGLKMELLHGISTDGAPSMVGTRQGVVSLFKIDCKDIGNDILGLHCIIHQENLCAKGISMDHVMKPVVKAINYVRSRGLTQRQF